MTEPSKFLEQVREAVRTKDWDSLGVLLGEDKVQELDHSEREKIAQLFFEHGSLLLENAAQASEMKLAFAALEKSVKLDVASEKSWIKFAEANFKLALMQEDSDLLERAAELFSHVDHLHKTRGHKLPVNVLWNWGVCLHEMAKCSEEASDVKLALDKFREASERGLDSAPFLFNYGCALAEMGVLVGNLDNLLEGAILLEKSIQDIGDRFIPWLRLACTLKILYLMTSDVLFFEKADQAYVAAARLLSSEKVKQQDEFEHWVNWGQLLLFEGKLTEDPELLTAGLEKLYLVEQGNSEDPFILTLIGDGLTHLGIVEDHIEFFKEGLAALERAHHLQPSSIDIICHLAHCLSNMGKYFADPIYIKQGIEYLQRGLSQQKNSHQLWHGLAMANFILAEIDQAPLIYEKASHFFAQAIQLGGDSPVYWNDWGVALMRLGELTNETAPVVAAIEKFEGAIESFNRKSVGKADPDWFYNYGCALDWLGGCESNPQYFERAIAILSRLLQQYPELYHIRYNLALSLYHLGDALGDLEMLEKAIHHFEIYLREEPEDDAALTDIGVTYLTMAEILQEGINTERSTACFAVAEKAFSHSIALGNTRANYYMACSYSLKNNVDQAMYFLERCKSQGALPPLDLLLEDHWMAPLAHTESFKTFISKLS